MSKSKKSATQEVLEETLQHLQTPDEPQQVKQEEAEHLQTPEKETDTVPPTPATTEIPQHLLP